MRDSMKQKARVVQHRGNKLILELVTEGSN